MERILGATYAQAVTVGTTPTLLDATPAARLNRVRLTLLINNASAATVYVGDSAVTTTSGYPLLAGERLSLDATHGAIYAVAAAPGDIRILEGY